MIISDTLFLIGKHIFYNVCCIYILLQIVQIWLAKKGKEKHLLVKIQKNISNVSENYLKPQTENKVTNNPYFYALSSYIFYVFDNLCCGGNF